MVSVVEPQAKDSTSSHPTSRVAAEPRRQSILMVGDSTPLGADRRTWLQASALRDAGFSVTVLAPQAEGRPGDYAGLAGVRLLPYRPAILPAHTARQSARAETLLLGRAILQEAFRGAGFSVLSLAQPAAIAAPLARLGSLLGKPVVIDYRVPEPEAALERGLVEDSEGYHHALRLENKLMLLADLVLCPNGAVQQVLAARVGAPRAKLALVPTGLDPNIGMEGTSMRPAARRRRYLVVFAGPLTPFSGADLFVRCARRLVYGLDRTDIQFVLAGSGPHAGAIRDLVAAEGLIDFVTCVPGDDQALVTSLLLSADLAVDPTPKSPLGELVSSLALQDYCRLGVPTVAFDRAETRHNDTVLVVDDGGVPELAQGILEALEQPLLREATISRDSLWSAEGGPTYVHALKKVLKGGVHASPVVASGH